MDISNNNKPKRPDMTKEKAEMLVKAYRYQLSQEPDSRLENRERMLRRKALRQKVYQLSSYYLI